MQSIDAGLSLASANGAARNALDRAAAAEADVLQKADAIRDLRDRVAASEAESAARLVVIHNQRELEEEYCKSFRAQEAIVHNARNEALELGRKLDAAETETLAATKRATEAEARVKELGEISDNSYHDYEVATKNAGVMADFIWNLMIEKKVDFIPGTTMNIIDAYKSRK
jgi:hypothetical protein